MATVIWEMLIICLLVGLMLGGVFRVNATIVGPVGALGLVLAVSFQLYDHGSLGEILLSALISSVAPGIAYFIGLFIKGHARK